jgi:hypothetical protein
LIFSELLQNMPMKKQDPKKKLKRSQPIPYRIFLASPSDVSDERELARAVIGQIRLERAFRYHLDLQCIAWDQPGVEAAMEANLTPQEAIKKGLPKPSECDIVVVILWSRIGTPLPPEYKKPDGTTYLSGTEWEYQDAIGAGTSVWLYRRSQVPSVALNDPEFQEKLQQWEKAEAFFKRFVGEGGSLIGGVNAYQTPDEFRRRFELHLRDRLTGVLEELTKHGLIEPAPEEPLKKCGPAESMSKETALVNLLKELFPSPESLKRFAFSLQTDSSILPSVLTKDSTKHLALWFVDELRRRGLVDEHFFGRLVGVRPDYAEGIKKVQDQWLVEVERWGVPATLELDQPRHRGAPTVFVSYSHADHAFFEELSTHLAILRRKGVIDFWHEGRIRAGEDWSKVIKRPLEESQIVILLISANFLSSDFALKYELPLALERQKKGKAVVIPVILRPCIWEYSPIASLQVFPSDGRSLAESTNLDRTWIALARQVEEAARRVRGTE